MKKFQLERYTLDAFFARILERYPDRPSLAKIGETPITYEEFGRRVSSLKIQLDEAGITKGDHIVILGPSSPNWSIAFMSIVTIGAVAVPVLEGFPEEDVEHIIRHSNAKAAFIADHYLETMSLPSLESMETVFVLNDLIQNVDNQTKQSVLKRTVHELPGKIRRRFEKETVGENILTIEEDDIAEILYTSGTTGHSKGVILTHANLVSNLFEGPDLLGVIHENSVVLSILPMAHAFGSTSAFLSIIYCGASIHYLDRTPSPKVLMDAMQKVRPTIMGAVPLVFEKIFHKRVVPMIAGNPLLRLMLKTRMTRRLLYRIVGGKVKRMLGGNLDCIIIGGATFSSEVETFMQEGGIPYCCGYGLSECSPLVTFSSMEEQKKGSPGHAITDVKIRIHDPEEKTGIGEILVKGPNVMKGYYRNRRETEKAFTDDGWFITGDRGYLDKDGFLFITGRSKNVIVGPSGENIYPEAIEAKLIESIFVEEALVYQIEGRLVARIHPNYTYIDSIAENREEASAGSDIERILETVRAEVNAKLPASSNIASTIEQSTPFVKTPTNKIRRSEYVPDY